MAVALSQRGPFSEEKYTLNSTTAGDTVSARTFSLGDAVFIPKLPETIEVLVDGVKLKGEGLKTTANSGDEFYVNNDTNPTSITIETNARLQSITDSTITALASGNILVIRRISNRSSKNVDYAPGSVIREVDLDNSNIQILHVAQEAVDIALAGMVLDADDKFNSQSKVIKNVANPASANDAVNKTYLEDTWLTATDKTNSATVAGISGNVTTVAGISANVTTVAGVSANVTTVATNIASVNTVATDIAKVIVVADDLSEAISEIETAALDLQETTSEIDTVSNSIANVNTVGTAIANVNTVAGISGNVTTVAGISGNVTTVAGISANTTTVAGISGNVTTVAGNNANVTKVANIDANVTKVANIDANVTKVANIDANVTTVAGIGTNGANVTTVAGISGNVTTVAGISSNVTSVAGVSANVTTVANNLSNINNFAALYQIDDFSPSAPTTDGSEASLADGDLAYDTTANRLKVYEGSAFVSIGLTTAESTVIADNSATAMAIALG
jgi:hypothetical protein